LSALQYYVYYKFDPARIEEVRAIVQQTFDEVRNATGVQGQWQQRRDDASTFMETYLGVADAGAFDRALAQALEKSGFGRLGIQRITEIFRCA
jgi:hypothetical protein